jgi:hypothetical protein
MERLNELIVGTLAVVGGILTNRIFKNQDSIRERVDALEKTIVTKEDLSPIERNIDIILTHILDTKK